MRGEVTKTWISRRLSEIAEVRPNKREIRDFLGDDALVSFVPMECLNAGTPHLSSHEVRPLEAVYKSYTYFRDGDVLLAKITPCFENGKLGVAKGLTNGVGFGSSEFFVIRPKQSVLAEYVYYYLEQQSFRDAGQRVMSGAVGHKRVPREFLEQTEIPLPPLEEQARIGAVLDEAFSGLDRARANAEANLQNARELFERTLTEIFDAASAGCREQKLGSLATFRNGLNYSRHSSGEQVKVIGVGDFQDNYWIPFGALKSVAIEGALAPEDEIKEDDLLAVRSNGNRDLIGRVMLAGAVPFPTSFSGFTIRVRLHEAGLSPRFLCQYLKTSDARMRLVASGGGANISNLNQKILADFVIKFPDLKAQEETMEKVNGVQVETEKLVSHYKTAINDLEDLRQSLLQKAFAGKLT